LLTGQPVRIKKGFSRLSGEILLFMKSNRKTSVKALQASPRPEVSAAGPLAAIGRKLTEIKKISGSGEMTEINMALFRHLK
jgi:hypothetical protein